MLAGIHATGALRRAQTLWTRFGLALVAAPALFAPCCSGMHTEVDCISATATDLSCSGGVTTGTMDVQVLDDENCPQIESAEFIAYNERDGRKGFDPDAGDILVSTLSADVSPPTSSVSMGSFSSSDPSGTIIATNWQLVVGNTNGTTSVLSGNV